MKECVVNGFKASRAVIFMSRTSMAVGRRTFLELSYRRHYLLKTCAKRKKNWQNN